MVPTKLVTPLVLPQLTATSATPGAKLGTMANTDAGGIAEYCYAVSELSQYAFCVIFDNFTAQMATTTLANDGGAGSKKIGVPQASVASAYYGWLVRSGVLVGRFSDDCADNVPLFTTATAGELDDATVSNCLVIGVYLNSTASLATALTAYAGMPMAVVPYTNPA